LEDVIQVENQFYVLATSSLADDRTRVLKYGESFAVFNRRGDIEAVGGQQGLYHRGTRYLSRFTIRIADGVPMLLRSTVQEYGSLFTMDLMNPDIYVGGHLTLARGSLHIFRAKFLWRGACFERVRISNFGLTPIETWLSLQFAVDYADIFHVRGMERRTMGNMLPAEISQDRVTLSYLGQDREVRRTILDFSPAPATLASDTARFALQLSPREEMSVDIVVACEHDNERIQAPDFDNAFGGCSRELHETRSGLCAVSSSNHSFNGWFSRAQSDVTMMINGNPEGPFPYAGVPWFSTVFGRDGLITAMECLWAAPWIAQTVLKYLALHQAVEVNPEREAEPGKILHEMRSGEMANLNEVPFGLYYGSVDATPLFVLLAGMYFEQTGDKAFIQSIWPNILAALDWVDNYGDVDGDSFVEYQAKTERGLIHQGWKDSHDAIFHADGTLADAPIALCEVQSYVYGARRVAAKMAASLGQNELANKLENQAEQIQLNFERKFWDEELGSYVLALDARKKPCRVLTSNAGHALLTGIASREHAARQVQTLLTENLFCGWGIRTVGSNELRYNPMAYHNGSVWPHDNAIIAAGFGRYGYKKEAGRVLASILEASTFMELNRLPELFCGFHKRPEVDGPTLYPVACSPQAWSAGAAYFFLSACLGMDFLWRDKILRFSVPYLPEGVKDVTFTGLRVGEAKLDLLIRQVANRVVTEVLGQEGGVGVEVTG
jgi:glycogen debranching enzyme